MTLKASVNYHVQSDEAQAFQFDVDGITGNLMHVSSTVSLLEIDLTTMHFKGLSLHVVFMLLPMLHNQGREVHGNILKEMTAIAESGGLKPLLDDGTFNLSQVGQAHERLASGKAIGKVVVTVD